MSVDGYVSRGGVKLRAALDAFQIDPTRFVCADLGCSVGGFTDCLLQAGALKVHSVDTAYGQLAYTLRRDERVTVHERSNALHTEPAEPVDLVVIDLGWTPQSLAIPTALKWLKPDDQGGGSIITLIKPHYELEDGEKDLLTNGVLSDEDGERIANRTAERLPGLGVEVKGMVISPLRGSPKKNKPEGVGNHEWLLLAKPVRG